jgi:AcrR family transcriptional regulator
MPRPYQRTEQRQQQIATAALDVIAERGLGEFTTRAIAERVGVTEGTLFRHFKNKSEIVWAAMGVLEQILFEDDPDPSAPPLQRLEAFFKRRARLIGGAHSIGHLAFSDQLRHIAGERGRARVLGWRKRNHAFVIGCLKEVHAQRDSPSLLSAQQLLPLVFGTVLVFFAQHLHEVPFEGALDARIDQAWSTLSTLIEASK